MFCILLAMSRVRAEVEPPAPQVMSQKAGWWTTMRSIRSNKFSIPSSVLGGKNSNEKTTPLFANPLWILSITFMLPCLLACATAAARRPPPPFRPFFFQISDLRSVRERHRERDSNNKKRFFATSARQALLRRCKSVRGDGSRFCPNKKNVDKN
jgi:hypothetical protein